MRKLSYPTPLARRASHLRALCDLSAPDGHLNPEEISRVIDESPDPASAVSSIFQRLPRQSELLGRKWRQLVVDMWSQHHPHIPILLDLPITSREVIDAPAVQDAVAFLRLLENRPAQMVREEGEWLLHPSDAYHFATNLPSQAGRPLVQLENEWQSLILRRLRANIQTLGLARRFKGELVLVKARHRRFKELPAIQQYYLLWHTDVYHTNWAEFSSLWSEYLHIMQACVPLVWDISEGVLPQVPYDIRRWNQEMWEAFAPIWEHEGLLERRRRDSFLFSYVRTHSLPTAVTQVVFRDLLERYGLVVSEGHRYLWTNLGIALTAAERTHEMPCALDLMK